MASESNYYDHYKDTWSLQQCYLSERNKLTISLLVLLVLVTGFMYEPANFHEKFNTCLDSRVKGLSFDLKYLNTGLIFLLLWVVSRYYQAVMKIDRMYDYLNDCEKKLSDTQDSYKINREGAYYYKKRSWMANVLKYCYGLLLPLAIIAIAIIKIVKESGWTTHFKVADFIGLGLVILLSLLFISNRWFKEEYLDKKRYPGMKWCDRMKAYFKRN